MLSLDALIDAFLAATRHTLRPNTRRAYRYDLALFARSLPALDIADLTIDHLCAFLAATTCAPSSPRPPIAPPPRWRVAGPLCAPVSRRPTATT